MSDPVRKIGCDDVGLFVDGELATAEAEAFRGHLAGCAACQKELGELMQLAAVSPALADLPVRVVEPAVAASVSAPPKAPPPARALVTSLDAVRARRRRALVVTFVPLLAAAAAGLLYVRLAHRAKPPESTEVALVSGPSRPLEIRVAYGAVDRYRPYDVARGASGSGVASAPPPLEALAALEKRGDLHGVAAAYLASGDRTQARAYLARAGHGADVDADRAALLLGDGDREGALALLDLVLAANPKHPQARWNRALVLRDLGLPLAAAAELDQVAALGEPGWSGEASARARLLRRDVERQHANWDTGRTAGDYLLVSGEIPPATDTAAHPGLSRLYFYDAVRSAPTADRVRALLPLAARLDGDDHGPLTAFAQRAAGADFAKRGPLAERYRKLALSPSAAPEKIDPLLADLRHAGADAADIYMGALVLTGRAGDSLAEYRRLADATGADPWFLAIAAGLDAKRDLEAGDAMGAERKYLAAIAAAGRARPAIDYRTSRLELDLARLYYSLHRVTEAQTHARAALASAQRDGDWAWEGAALFVLGDIARLRHSVPLMRAVFVEALARDPDACDALTWVHEAQAMTALYELDADGAKRELAALEKCPATLSIPRASELVDIAHLTGHPEDASGVLEGLAELRRSGALAPGESADADAIEGRLVITTDRVAGRTLLRRAIDEANALPAWDANGRKARAIAYSALVADAAEHGEAPAAIALVAEELRVPPRDRCSLALSLDDERLTVLAHGPDGAVLGGVTRRTTATVTSALEPAALVPPNVSSALVACPEVEVYAAPPLQGLAGILPAQIAWGYRVAPDRAAGATDGKRVVLADVEPPASLALPRLSAWEPAAPGDLLLAGSAATPSRALAAFADAAEIEIHAHGFVDAAISDVSLIALTPDETGDYALTAGAIRKARLRGAPLVILAACRAAQAAPYLHEAWSLPSAFLEAGARAVVASPADVGDRDAGAFFGVVRARIRSGESPARAVRDARTEWLRRDPGSWVSQVLVFD